MLFIPLIPKRFAKAGNLLNQFTGESYKCELAASQLGSTALDLCIYWANFVKYNNIKRSLPSPPTPVLTFQHAEHLLAVETYSNVKERFQMFKCLYTHLALSSDRVLNIGHVAVRRLNRAVCSHVIAARVWPAQPPSPPPHCGSADGSCVTSPFLPPCFDPAVLIVQTNPILPESLAQRQDCY